MWYCGLFSAWTILTMIFIYTIDPSDGGASSSESKYLLMGFILIFSIILLVVVVLVNFNFIRVYKMYARSEYGV